VQSPLTLLHKMVQLSLNRYFTIRMVNSLRSKVPKPTGSVVVSTLDLNSPSSMRAFKLCLSGISKSAVSTQLWPTFCPIMLNIRSRRSTCNGFKALKGLLPHRGEASLKAF
jgi:hypothetical protein